MKISFGCLTGLLAALVIFSSRPAFANYTSASEPLYRQVALIDLMSPYVERLDMARLLVVRNSASSVIRDMEINLKEGRNEITFQTLRLIQNLIIQYRFSQVFFGWTEPRSITSIYTPQTGGSLAELKGLSESLVREYGYDDSPYTQITANTFRQMQRLLKQLEDLPFDPTLKGNLRALWMPIGESIAMAEQGDRPKTFERAIPVIRQIRTMYSEFDRISSSQAGFAMIMELQGLTEFYAEFAQID